MTEEKDKIEQDITILEEIKKHTEDWFESQRKAREAEPYVAAIAQMVNWRIRALKERPEEADEIPYRGMTDELTAERDYLLSNFQPARVPDNLNLSTGVVVSGTSDTGEYIRQVGTIPTTKARSYYIYFRSEYQQMQEKQERLKNVRELLEKLSNPQTVKRFDDAYITYTSCINGTGTREAAGTHIRNLITGVWGDLKQLATRWPDENMTWEIMADHLAKDGVGSIFYNNLIREKKKRSDLLDELPDILKDREGKSARDLEDLWTRTLDHIFTVLSSINT